MSKGKYKRNILEKAAEQFDLPSEAAANLPIITVTGCRKIHIENHHGILGYTDEEMTVNCGKMILKIAGSGLELKGMTDAEILIVGTLDSVHFEY